MSVSQRRRHASAFRAASAATPAARDDAASRTAAASDDRSSYDGTMLTISVIVYVWPAAASIAMSTRALSRVVSAWATAPIGHATSAASPTVVMRPSGEETIVRRAPNGESFAVRAWTIECPGYQSSAAPQLRLARVSVSSGRRSGGGHLA